jgi:integrase
MATDKITVSRIKKLAVEGGWIWDTETAGFGARRQTKDVHFYLRYRLGGRQYMKRIGRLGAPWTPDTARQTARVGLGEVAQGKHPTFGNGHKAEGDTFGDLVPKFLDRKRPELRPKTYAELARHLTQHSALLHQLRLGEIDKRRIADHLDNVEKATGGVTRNRVRVSLSAFWNWANRQALAEDNPVRGTDTAKEYRRDRVLSDTELAAVWRALGPDRFDDIVRLLILTGQRRNEIADLRWSEIDLVKAVIKLPAARTKNKHAHEVPLSAMARAILEGRRAPSQTTNAELVFGRITSWSWPKAALDQRCAIPPWTIHDLRRTCATGLGNLRIPPHVIETVLNHRGGHKAGVAGTYNYSAYPEEVREALDKWAAHVAEIVGAVASPANGHPHAINIG